MLFFNALFTQLLQTSSKVQGLTGKELTLMLDGLDRVCVIALAISLTSEACFLI